ncbi:hypothetical protein B296_00055808 [Ensete ventricosum]|uniref:Uncharacterized protein n=1 Tax=Ensete ventricosum TaxID=4639 RepID=A0A426X827_ENSVE|nr:hypothetical protein B296_00055808 [Ensete ventricosum]
MFNGFDVFGCIGVWSGFERCLRRFLGFGSAGMATKGTTPRVAGAIFDPACPGYRVVEVVVHSHSDMVLATRDNLATFLAKFACGNAALSNVCAQGRDGDGHTVDGPGRTLRRSHVGGSRIKRRPCAGLPQPTDRSRDGSSRAGKQPPHATKVAQAATSHASNDSPRIPATASQRLAITQAVNVR